MLSTLMTDFIRSQGDEYSNVLIWWDKLETVDPQIRSKEMIEGVKNKDITKNEFRAYIGLPPLEEEEKEQPLIAPEVVDDVIKLLGPMGEGLIEPSQAIAILEGMGISTDLASRIAVAKEEAGGTEGKSFEETIRVAKVLTDWLKIPLEGQAKALARHLVEVTESK